MNSPTDATQELKRSDTGDPAIPDTRLEHLFRRNTVAVHCRDLVITLLASTGGFVAIALLLGVMVEKTSLRPPPPLFEVLSEKMDYVQNRGREFDLFLIGTSRVYRGLIPSVLDEELTKHGKPMRSLNLGVPALSLLEQEALMHQVLAERESSRSTTTPTILIEPIPVLLRIRNWASERGRAFSKFDDAAVNLEYLAGIPNYTSRALRWKSSIALLLGLGAKAVHLGSGSRMIFPGEDLFKPRRSSDPQMESSLGYRPREMETSEFFKQTELAFQARLRDSNFLEISRGGPSFEISSGEINRLVKLITEAEDEGWRVVLLVAPNLDSIPWLPDLPQRLKVHLPRTPWLDYSPRSESDLYVKSEYWFDESHLSQRGAQYWSRILAEDLAPLLR